MIFHLLMWRCDQGNSLVWQHWTKIFLKEIALSFLKRIQLLMKQIGHEEQNGYEKMVALSKQSTNAH